MSILTWQDLVMGFPGSQTLQGNNQIAKLKCPKSFESIYSLYLLTSRFENIINMNYICSHCHSDSSHSQLANEQTVCLECNGANSMAISIGVRTIAL
jgi:hypothetical protein